MRYTVAVSRRVSGAGLRAIEEVPRITVTRHPHSRWCVCSTMRLTGQSLNTCPLRNRGLYAAGLLRRPASSACVGRHVRAPPL
jgi:hypothetical protein